MRALAGLITLCAGLLYAQPPLPTLEGETLSGRKVSLPAATGGQPSLLIIGFNRGSQAQTKAWSLRVRNRYPAWSIAVVEDVPRMLRGMVAHGIKSGIPKEEHDRFVLVSRGEKQLKQAVRFDRPDDAYLLVIDKSGTIQWTFHGPVTDTAIKQIATHFAH